MESDHPAVKFARAGCSGRGAVTGPILPKRVHFCRRHSVWRATARGATSPTSPIRSAAMASWREAERRLVSIRRGEALTELVRLRPLSDDHSFGCARGAGSYGKAIDRMGWMPRWNGQRRHRITGINQSSRRRRRRRLPAAARQRRSSPLNRRAFKRTGKRDAQEAGGNDASSRWQLLPARHQRIEAII